MAISMTKYVEISSTFPTQNISARSLSGCVFTPEEMQSSSSTSSKKTAYDNGEVVEVASTDLATFFGASTLVYSFANKYYSYISRSGNSVGVLRVCKVKKNSEGTAYESPVEAFRRARAGTVTFGSFTFLEASGLDIEYTISQEELLTVAGENSGLGSRYLFVVNDVRGSQTSATVASKCAEYNGVAGCVFISGYDKYSAYMPMAIFDATDYVAGPVPNQMFKQFANETRTVSSDDEYDTFKAAKVNFYGRTQMNGSSVDFYQRGFNTDGVDTAIYCNEVWFKGACADVLMSRLLSEERVPANDVGLAIVRSDVTSICAIAVVNGSFMAKSVGDDDYKKISVMIQNLGGAASDATEIVRAVAVSGYSVYCILRKDESGENFIDYYVFYGTADSVRFIRGTNYLIK